MERGGTGRKIKTPEEWVAKIKAILKYMPMAFWSDEKSDEDSASIKVNGTWIIIQRDANSDFRIGYWTDDTSDKGEWEEYGNQMFLEWAIVDAIVRSYVMNVKENVNRAIGIAKEKEEGFDDEYQR